MVVATQRAEALYLAQENATDTVTNYAGRTTSTTTFSIGGKDLWGWAKGTVERYDGPLGGLQGVRINLTTHGGSTYLKGFVRCRKDQDADDYSAVYTHYDSTADTTKWASYCNWLDGGGITWSRVGWGGHVLTTEIQPANRISTRGICGGDGAESMCMTLNVLNPYLTYYNALSVPDWSSGKIAIARNESIAAISIFNQMSPKCW
jgi:hypothetical protein